MISSSFSCSVAAQWTSDTECETEEEDNGKNDGGGLQRV